MKRSGKAMNQRGEDGYILASAIAVLLAISLVASAMMSTSVDGLRRVQRLETDVKADAFLRSAILVVTSQLAMDPRRRQVDFGDGNATLDVLDQKVTVRISWENAKIDINRAELKTIHEAVYATNLDESSKAAAERAIESFRGQQKPVTLFDDLGLAPDLRECLGSVLTVFGGQLDYAETDANASIAIGRPAAGARLAIEVWPSAQPARGLGIVAIMTGDPQTPAKILDWRPYRAEDGERCHDASK